MLNFPGVGQFDYPSLISFPAALELNEDLFGLSFDLRMSSQIALNQYFFRAEARFIDLSRDLCVRVEDQIGFVLLEGIGALKIS